MADRLRRAVPADIPALSALRLSVRENRLADPSRVTPADYARHLAATWVWDAPPILGFAAADPASGTLWALFVAPEAEGRGIGRALLEAATADLAAHGRSAARATTDPGTRAHRVYLAAGWQDDGPAERGEIALRRTLPDPSSTPPGRED